MKIEHEAYEAVKLEGGRRKQRSGEIERRAEEASLSV